MAARLKEMYTKEVAPALFKKFGDPFPDFCISEEGSDKLSGAVRFVTAGETAGNEDHLAVLQTRCKTIDTARDAFCREVVHHEYFRFCPGVTHSTGTVDFAVGAGKRGNQYAGFCCPDNR